MADGAARRGAVAFILKGYPRLSETFIAEEIRALEQRGLKIVIISLRHPTDPHRHPVHEEIAAPVLYLPEYLHDEPARLWRAWRALRRRPSYRRARALWRADLARDRTRNRVRRFGQALVLAHELAPEITRLHAHFLHTPASVARYAAVLSGLPWSCSAHAKDIWTTPDWDIREKLADMDWLVTCTAYGRNHLAALAPDPDRVSLCFHGLDPARFPAPDHPADRDSQRDGRDPAMPVRLLSVGRAVPKKGYDVLLAALARLPEDLHWRLDHVGGGDALARLREQAATHGLAGRIVWHGPQPQTAVLARYRAADLFVLASVVAADGDRDGLPNVLLEAQSQGLACLSTRVSAIPELIADGVTGVLVPPGDAAALARALAGLIADPARRDRLGAAGQARVRRDFSQAAAIDTLSRTFGLTTASEPAPSPCTSPSTHR